MFTFDFTSVAPSSVVPPPPPSLPAPLPSRPAAAIAFAVETSSNSVAGSPDPSLYTIQICIPKHALSWIFSFTNGVDWDGPYKLQFQVPKALSNKPIDFFNEGLARELSNEGACERAIFPDTDIVVSRCALIGNLTLEGGDRCDLNLIPGCTDPSSPSYNPLANVDEGSCPVDLGSEE